jgi:ssDNA-binding Zn-finger/Zn-ribbon topoisomerase 1
MGCSGYPKCKNTAEVPAKLLEELGLNAAASNGDANGHAGANGKADAKPQAADDEEIPTDLSVE